MSTEAGIGSRKKRDENIGSRSDVFMSARIQRNREPKRVKIYQIKEGELCQTLNWELVSRPNSNSRQIPAARLPFPIITAKKLSFSLCVSTTDCSAVHTSPSWGA